MKRHSIYSIAVTVLAISAPPHPASSQEGPANQPAEAAPIIRVMVGRSQYVGSLSRLDPDTLVMRVDDRTVIIPRRYVDAASRLNGKRSAIGKGAGIGALLGAAANLVIASAGVYQLCSSQYCDTSGPQGVAIYLGAGAAGAGMGAILGAMVGSALKVDRWTPLARTATFRLNASPSGAGITVRMPL